MIYPEADKLEDWGSKYALVALAAKRAKQIKAGAPILVDTQSRNPLTIALEEIAAGRVICTVSDEDIVISSSAEPEVAELLAIPIEPEDETEEAEAKEHEEEEAAAVIEEAAEDEVELLEEEEEEEEDALGADDVWKEVLGEDAEEEAGIVPPIGIDPDAVDAHEVESDSEEAGEVAEKPKRRGRRSTKAAALPTEEPEEIPDIEASEDQSEED
jgi:DNA-directed RNA polymerase subunit omega